MHESAAIVRACMYACRVELEELSAENAQLLTQLSEDKLVIAELNKRSVLYLASLVKILVTWCYLSVCLSVTLLSVITADMIKLVALAPCSLSDEITTILDKSAWRPELEAWIKYSLQQNEQFVISCQFVQTWLCLQTIQDMDTDTVVMIKR